MRRCGAIPVLLTAAFFFRGVFLNLALPYGDPLDEIFHYGYASYLAETGRVPRAAEASVAVECVRPLAWLPHSTSFGGRRLLWKEFASLADSERRERRGYAYRYLAGERTRFVSPNYEVQQPPLAYLAVRWLLALLSRATLDRRLLALRFFASATAAATVPLAYGFFRRLLPKRSALAATVAFLAFPGIGSFAGRFTNDALALPVVAAMLGLFVDVSHGHLSRRGAVGLTGLLALGCWTKLYVLLFLPVAPLVALLSPRRDRATVFTRSLTASVLAFLLFSPWMFHQHGDTGDWLGLTPTKDATQAGVGLLDRIGALPGIFNLRFAIIFGRTFLWPGTWSAMGAPAVVAVVLSIPLLLLFLVPNLAGDPQSRGRRRSWGAAAVAVALFLLGHLAYASTYAAVARQRGHPPSAGPDGWFFLILFPVVLAAGSAFGRSVPSRLFLSAAGIFVIGEYWVTFGVLHGVYAGWIVPNGANAPFTDYSALLLRPVAALRVFGSVGLAGASALWLGLALSAWFLALLSAAMLVARRPKTSDK